MDPASATAHPPASTTPERGRLLSEWLVLIATATVLVALLLITHATSHRDNALYDFAIRFRERPPPSDIVIVSIDTQSISRQGEWPWPRQLQAALLRDVARGHPRAIALDVLLEAHGAPEGDEAFREAMKLVPVFLPMVLQEPRAGHAGQLSRPIPEFAMAAAGLGRGNPSPDSDGIVRRAHLNSRFGGAPLPHIMALMANWGRGAPVLDRRDQDAEFLIPYEGPAEHFKTVSADDVLRGAIAPDVFKNRYVLIGATARELLDYYTTPSSGASGMSNVEIDANILNGLVHRRLITAVPLSITVAMSVGVLWLLGAGILLLQPGQLFLQGAAAGALCFSGAAAGVALAGLWIPPVSVIITSILLQFVWFARRLQAASDYFASELAELQTRGGGALAPPPPGRVLPAGDSVSRQMMLIQETKARLRNLRRFVSEVLANFPDPVLVVSRRGRVIIYNQAAATLADRLGRPLAAGERIEAILNDLEADAGEGRKLWPPPGEGEPPRGVGPGGRILEARYTPTGYHEGQALGWTVQLVDVTALVSATRQREEALKLFTHDMRAPLSAILAALENEAAEALPPALRVNIEANALRTLSLADGFVRLAMAESPNYVFEPIDLVHTLGDAADALWAVSKAASVAIVIDDPGREFVVSADRALLSRALINLIDTGIRVSPPGASVTCTLAPAALRGRPAVALAVADQTDGMTVERQRKLFKRFARTKTTVGEGRGGAVRYDSVGLGLAVVHTVVTRHDGVLDRLGEAGGTTFIVTLPLIEEGHPECGALEVAG